jgi:hypothetical protein
MTRKRRITQADYRAAGRGLARDCADDVARGLVPADPRISDAKSRMAHAKGKVDFSFAQCHVPSTGSGGHRNKRRQPE